MSLTVLLLVELRKLWQERVFRGALGIFLAASLIAIGVGALRLRAERSLFAGIERDDDARYAKMAADLSNGTYSHTGFGDLTSPGVIGLVVGPRSVVFPSGELGVLAVGQRDVAPLAARISIRTETFGERYDAVENPRRLAIGAFDFAFVVVFVFPLLVFALSYDLVSSERERGTLVLLLSQATPFGRILAAKIGARLLVLAATTVLVVAVAALVSGAPWSAVLAVRLIAAVVAVLLYGAFWFSLAVAIQRLRRSSQTNALLALGAWLLFVIVLPASIDAAARLVSPVPPRIRLFEVTREAQRDAARREDQELARYYGDHPQFSAPGAQSEFWVRWVVRSRQVEAAVQPLKDHFARQLASEQRLVERLGVVSPPVTIHKMLADVAGAGQAREHDFLEQAETFATTFRRFFEERELRGQRLTVEDYARIPRFTWQEEPPSHLLARLAGRLAALAVPALLLTVAAFARIGRVRWLAPDDVSPPVSGEHS